MKKLLLLLTVVFIAVSCELESDERKDFSMSFMPIISVDMPASVTPGRTYTITMYYSRLNDCYYVSDRPYYEIVDNIRTVAVQAILVENANCRTTDTESSMPEQKSFDFQCPLTTAQNFKFRFYKGVNEQGYQEFLEYVVPVQQ